MNHISEDEYKDNPEIGIPWITNIYHNKEEDSVTRFDNAYFLLLEQRYIEQRYGKRGNLK